MVMPRSSRYSYDSGKTGPSSKLSSDASSLAATVKNFLALNEAGAIARYKTASIGPITTETLRMHGIEPTVEATPHTTEGVINAILRYHHPQS